MGIELGRVVREKMRALELTYDKTAELAGISRTYVAKIIQGARDPEDETVLKLAEVLEMDKKELLFISHRDKTPEEAKAYFGLKPVPTFQKIFRDHLPPPEYVEENRYSRKFIELAKKIDDHAKKRIEHEKDFESRLREARDEFAGFLTRDYRDPRAQRRKEQLLKQFERLGKKKMEAYREKLLRKKELFGFDLPLLTDKNPRDPYLLFGKEKAGHIKWELRLEKTAVVIPFAYRLKDDSMMPAFQKGDTVIGATGSIESLEDLIGKVVIAKIKKLGVIVRYYNHKDKNAILTASSPSFPPHILKRGEIEWLHPIKGIYRAT